MQEIQVMQEIQEIQEIQEVQEVQEVQEQEPNELQSILSRLRMLEAHVRRLRGRTLLNPPSVTIVFERQNSEIPLPAYAYPGDAGMDVFLPEACTLAPGESRVISTGLRCVVPQGYELQVRPKSGLAAKHHITVLNTPGTIDSGFRGEIGVILINHGSASYTFRRGEKIAQLVCAFVVHVTPCEGNVSNNTPRGAGGFGSTGQ